MITPQQLITPLDLTLPSPVQELTHTGVLTLSSESFKDSRFFVKRDDLIHGHISGNKWRKLSSIAAHIQQNNIKHVISFGGAYSNHLHALAFLCQHMHIKLTAIVRGDYANRPTPTLLDIKNWGANIHYVTKLEYKLRTEDAYCINLQKQLNADLVVPEGGSHQDALGGMETLVKEYQQQIDGLTHVILPVASAGTMAGVIAATERLYLEKLDNESANKDARPHIMGIGVLKGEGYLESLIQGLLIHHQSALHQVKWHVEHDYHHGGYAKHSRLLHEFIQAFEAQHNIPIEPVYSAKCFYALAALIQRGFFPPKSKVLIIHTGGLQGKRLAAK